MIGSIHLGDMDDNRVEAWSGYRIDQVAKKAELSLSKLPNVVAILAGTNDAGQGFDTRTYNVSNDYLPSDYLIIFLSQHG